MPSYPERLMQTNLLRLYTVHSKRTIEEQGQITFPLIALQYEEIFLQLKPRKSKHDKCQSGVYSEAPWVDFSSFHFRACEPELGRLTMLCCSWKISLCSLVHDCLRDSI